MTYRNHPVTDYASVVGANSQFVDVRTPQEVATGTLEGAVNIPLDQLPARLVELDASRRTVLLCRSGNRSGQAAAYLSGAGFTDVINLDGGMLAYSKGDSR